MCINKLGILRESNKKCGVHKKDFHLWDAQKVMVWISKYHLHPSFYQLSTKGVYLFSINVYIFHRTEKKTNVSTTLYMYIYISLYLYIRGTILELELG